MQNVFFFFFIPFNETDTVQYNAFKSTWNLKKKNSVDCLLLSILCACVRVRERKRLSFKKNTSNLASHQMNTSHLITKTNFSDSIFVPFRWVTSLTTHREETVFFSPFNCVCVYVCHTAAHATAEICVRVIKRFMNTTAKKKMATGEIHILLVRFLFFFCYGNEKWRREEQNKM